MKISKKYNVTRLKDKELITISGGDELSQGFFGWLGTVFGSIVAAGNAEQEHGVHGWHGTSGEW